MGDLYPCRGQSFDTQQAAATAAAVEHPRCQTQVYRCAYMHWHYRDVMHEDAEGWTLADESMCPHCGVLCGVDDDFLTSYHDWPVPTRQVCPGSKQIPRCALSDGRVLWNGEPNLHFYRRQQPSVMDMAMEWATLAKQAFPEHAHHEMVMDDRGTWCKTCDVTLVPVKGNDDGA